MKNHHRSKLKSMHTSLTETNSSRHTKPTVPYNEELMMLAEDPFLIDTTNYLILMSNVQRL